MILYHGSNTEIMEIDLSKCRPFKDFGSGFYLTGFKEQAVRMAANRAALYGGSPVITVFEADDNIMEMPELNTRIFSLKPTVEWARFIVNNRSKELSNQYSFHTERAVSYLRKVGVLSE